MEVTRKKVFGITLIIALILSLFAAVDVAFAASKKPATPGKPTLTKKAVAPYKGASYKNYIIKATSKAKGATSYEFRWVCTPENNIISDVKSNTCEVKVSPSAKQKLTVKCKVRAVRKVGNNKYYSSWSDWGKISIPKDKNAPRG